MNDRNSLVRARRARLSLVAALALAAACSSPPADPSGAAAAERVGVYDGRAVVIAYANGPRFERWMSTLRAERDAAEAAGDDARVAALEAKAVAQQERFHGQAFGGDDVDDVLAMVVDSLPAILAEHGVVRLEKLNRERRADVVTVDVTDPLVELFEPDEKGRGWIADVRKKPFPK